MVVKVSGIVLRETKILRAKKVYAVFTKEEGKISVFARDSKKSKEEIPNVISFMNFILDKKRENYKLITSKSIFDTYEIAKDYDKYILLSNVLKFIDKCVPEGGTSEELYYTLFEYYENLISTNKPKYLTIYTYIKIMKELGIIPESEDPNIKEAISFFASKKYEEIKGYKLKEKTENSLFEKLEEYVHTV